MVDVCYQLADQWEALSHGKTNFKPQQNDIDGWLANQSVVFLERVQLFDQPLSADLAREMGEIYGYGSSQNVELVSRYFQVGLRARYEGVYKPTAQLLTKVGRMKFVRPLYRELKKADRALAFATFEEARLFYHPICRAMVEKDLFSDEPDVKA
jgi:leukotriene-A4 hydrolase